MLVSRKFNFEFLFLSQYVGQMCVSVSVCVYHRMQFFSSVRQSLWKWCLWSPLSPPTPLHPFPPKHAKEEIVFGVNFVGGGGGGG